MSSVQARLNAFAVEEQDDEEPEEEEQVVDSPSDEEVADLDLNPMDYDPHNPSLDYSQSQDGASLLSQAPSFSSESCQDSEGDLLFPGGHGLHG